MSVWGNPVALGGAGGSANIQALSITQNGTYTASGGVDGYSPVTVSVSGGGGGTATKGFELAFANGDGNTQTGRLLLDNSYFVCYFDDNMSSTYTLNGVSRTMSVVASGNQQTLADTLEVTNPPAPQLNAVLAPAGSAFTFHHGDSGSYCSVVGGWTGYPSGGTIYKQAAYGTQNAITLAEAHDTLLVFIGACGSLSSYNTVSVNGISYTVTNIGNHYGQIAIYGAIELGGNTDTTVTVELPVSCYSFVSVVGLDSIIEDVQAFGGRVVVKEVWNASHTYKALKWYFCGVSVTSTSGNSFTEPLLSLRPANNRPNGHAWNTKCYPNKGSYSGDLCIHNGMLKYISTPYHYSWITGSDLYGILYTAHPDYTSSFSETDFTTLAGYEGDTQQNEWEEP